MKWLSQLGSAWAALFPAKRPPTVRRQMPRQPTRREMQYQADIEARFSGRRSREPYTPLPPKHQRPV